MHHTGRKGIQDSYCRKDFNLPILTEGVCTNYNPLSEKDALVHLGVWDINW